MTKRELIRALEALDCPDETLVARHVEDWRTTAMHPGDFEVRRLDDRDGVVQPLSCPDGQTVVVVWT